MTRRRAVSPPQPWAGAPPTSPGNHEQLQNVSDAFRYLEEIYRCREKKYALPMCSYNAANLFFGSVKLMPKRPPPTLSSKTK